MSPKSDWGSPAQKLSLLSPLANWCAELWTFFLNFIFLGGSFRVPPITHNFWPCHPLWAPRYASLYGSVLNREKVINTTGISVRQLRKMQRNWEEFGEIVRPQLTSWRPQRLNHTHQQALLKYSEQMPTVLLDEISWFLWAEFQL